MGKRIRESSSADQGSKKHMSERLKYRACLEAGRSCDIETYVFTHHTPDDTPLDVWFPSRDLALRFQAMCGHSDRVIVDTTDDVTIPGIHFGWVRVLDVHDHAAFQEIAWVLGVTDWMKLRRAWFLSYIVGDIHDIWEYEDVAFQQTARALGVPPEAVKYAISENALNPKPYYCISAPGLARLSQLV